MATQTETKRWAREYETIYIVDPSVDQSEVEQISDRMTGVVGKMEGKMLRLDNWGKRRLAYKTNKNSRGYYMYMRYLGYSDMVLELERNLRMQDKIFRFQTSVIDEHRDIAATEVDPEEVKFRASDDQSGDEPELTLEQELGLVEAAPRATASFDDSQESEDEESGSDETTSEDQGETQEKE